MAGVTERLARFITETSIDNIDQKTIAAAKRHILDTVGCLFAGSVEAGSRIGCAYVSEIGAGRASSMIPSGQKTSSAYAALANGLTAHLLDYDDYEWPSMAHPSVTVLPAALALGENRHLSGRQFMTAYLVGLEVISHLGLGICPDHYEKGWHSTGTLGTIGAAGASVKALGLDSDHVRSALGIAASMSSGLRANFGSMTKAYHAGHAARCGVEAALLASKGFTAAAGVFEDSKLGFCEIFTGKGQYDLNLIVRDLGDPFAIQLPGLGLKPYPSCAATHSTLDGLFHLIAEHAIKAEAVDSVECGIFYMYPQMLIHSRPRTGLEGKFSLEFCVALALMQREVRLNGFTDAMVKKTPITALIRQVKTYVAKELGGRGTQYPGAIVKVNLKNGKSHTYRVKNRKGSPANPLTEAEVLKKFLDCAGRIYKKSRCEEIAETILNLEQCNDMAAVVDLLVD